MAIEVIHCPSCRAEVRVPDTLFGTTVRCPRCRASFKAPVRNSDGALVGIELLPDAFEAAPMPPGRNPLLVPGVALSLVGLIGLLVNGLVVYRTLAQTEAVAADLRAELQDPNSPLAKVAGDRIKPEDITPEAVRQTGSVVSLFAIQNVLVIVGAASMLWMRFYGLAMLGCVLAMVDVGFFCCLIGLPVGFWGIVRLRDPTVRMLFR